MLKHRENLELVPADGVGVGLVGVGEPEAARARHVTWGSLHLGQQRVHARVHRELRVLPSTEQREDMALVKGN